MKLTKRAECITPSLTLAITAKANKMKEEGISIIGFGAGEPDFNTPNYIIESAKKALDNGKTKYTPSSGTLDVRKAICAKLKNDNNLDYQPSQIVVSNGAKHSLYNAMLAIIEEGDEVIIPAPYWLTYPELVTLCGGTVKYLEATEENDFKITAKDLKNAISSKTKALVLNSPSNPTGSVYTKEELFELSKVVEEAKIAVISDEIYEKLVYGDAKHYSIASVNPQIKDQVILVNGVSKTYSMTGWRIGYLAAPLNVAKAIDGIQSHATSNPNTMSQFATVTALTSPEGEVFLKEMRETFDERRKYMVETIGKIPNISCTNPNGAFYVMMNVSNLFGKNVNGKTIQGSLDVTDLLLDYGVAVVPGIAFGADKYIRLSYAISLKDIAEGLKRIEKFVSDVK